MKKHKKRILPILLSLVLMLGLMPGMSLTALAYDGNPYASLVGTTNSVTFNGKPWYIIADNSTAVDAGTVTLLAADTSFGLSEFSDRYSNDYSISKVKASLDDLTTSGSFKDVADAIETNTDAGGKLYLLSTSEAQQLSPDVLKMNFSSKKGGWWLRSPGGYQMAAFVYGEYGYVNASGDIVDYEFGVRPALKLNLSSVIFSSESKTFSLKPSPTDGKANFNDETIPIKKGDIYSTDGGSTWKTADEDNPSLTDLGWDGEKPVTVIVRDNTGKETTYDVPARPDAPTNVTAQEPSEPGKKDGKITGVDDTMEYSVDGGKTWKPVTGDTIDGLGEGEVLVRTAPTDQQPAGKPAVIVIGDQTKDAVSKIDALPDKDKVTPADKDAIEAARAAYNALSDEQKAQVPAETLKKLTDAEEALLNGSQPTIYFRCHIQNLAWDKQLTKLEVGKSGSVGTTGRSLRLEALDVLVPEGFSVTGFAHLQDWGDTDVTKIDNPDFDVPEGYTVYRFGTTGQSRRMEALSMGIVNAKGEYVKGLRYTTHLQNYSWQGYVRNGSFAGTRGMSLRLEAIRFAYTDDDNVKAGEPK